MHSAIEMILARGPVITDGAWGTQFQARGLSPGECPEAWNLSHRQAVEEVAKAYVEAGSQIILTNTFGANSLMLRRHGLEGQTEALNRAGVEISLAAAAGVAAVFASMGPTGKLLIEGEATEAGLRAVYEEQARILAASGPAGIVLETMSDLEECVIALAAARETGLPVIVSMTFDSGKNRDRTMMGVTPEQAAKRLTEAGADGLGANCGSGIEAYVGICARLHAATQLPVWIKPNAGLPEMENGRTVYRTSAVDFAAHLPALLDAGASFIGGCCGTTPEFIRTLRSRMPRVEA
jgi:5-methyltetrahydrofolate--homocysteine methyltransferase